MILRTGFLNKKYGDINILFLYNIGMKNLKIAHLIWKEHLQKNNLKKNLCVVDATCGNGHDSFFLANLSNIHLHCIDIQKEAIDNTKIKLKELHHTPISYHNRCHSNLDFISEPIDLITYNLGYLPGSDKSIITSPLTTIGSINSTLEKGSDKMMISIMIYTGHQGGKCEKTALFDFFSTLDQSVKVSHTRTLTKTDSPELVILTN